MKGHKWNYQRQLNLFYEISGVEGIVRGEEGSELEKKKLLLML